MNSTLIIGHWTTSTLMCKLVLLWFGINSEFNNIHSKCKFGDEDLASFQFTGFFRNLIRLYNFSPEFADLGSGNWVFGLGYGSKYFQVIKVENMTSY